MKRIKFILLTLLTLINYSCFSQIVTNKIIDSTKITLTNDVAKLVVKDLIKYDNCTEELKLTQEKVYKLNEVVVYKDSIINYYKEKTEVLNYVITQKDNQIKQYEDYTKSLTKEIRLRKIENFFYKVGSYVFAATSIIFIIKN